MAYWSRDIFISERPVKSLFYNRPSNGAFSLSELFRLLMDYDFRMQQISLINQDSIKFSFQKY